ncbi:hypothetical protein [Streptomyces asoensis]|uniref:Lipoprotein n=1 Tax=Streptomyces asoensis TaxID=249586 RepID=A0ABQ3S3B5_9ACTN|nr:hypothetical protein [Streptomyces asoensis]GGR00877.1 hypothetical protein GCM10010496_77400 [Streptomyces asoensis]GHI62603.1 hypothetical protein Saso_42530 [Streptomyces asoensis]
MPTRPTNPDRPLCPSPSRSRSRRGGNGRAGGRLRLIAAALTAVAALTLTACHDGQGLRDEGPSGSSTLKR